VSKATENYKVLCEQLDKLIKDALATKKRFLVEDKGGQSLYTVKRELEAMRRAQARRA